MDNLIMYLLELLYASVKKNLMKRIYVHKGKSHRSFVFHAIALAYELFEVDKDEDGSSHTIDEIAKWKVNGKGEGEIVMDHYNGLIKVYTNSKKTCTVQLIKGDTLFLNERPSAEKFCQELNANTEGLHYEIVDGGEYVYISISAELEGDPTESDARNYINGLLETVLVPAREALQKKIYFAKKNNQINIYNI